MTSYHLKVTVTSTSWFSDFALYLHYLMDLHYTWDSGLGWHREWPQTIYISNTIWRMYIILGIVGKVDSGNDLLPFIGRYDLYFIVQWFLGHLGEAKESLCYTSPRHIRISISFLACLCEAKDTLCYSCIQRYTLTKISYFFRNWWNAG